MRIINGQFVNPADGRNEKMDILIEDGMVTRIGNDIFNYPQDADIVIDAKGCIVAPGLVDVHSHFRDPGFTYKEDIASGAEGAAAGGYTTVVLMANTKPPVDGVETLHYVLEKGKKTDIHVETCATVTMGMQGEILTNLDRLYDCGAVGFTDDGKPIMDEQLVETAMKKAKELNVPISFHEENPVFIENNGVNKGKASEYFGIGGSPREAEINLIARDLEIALKTGACINIQHISSKEGVDLVRQAKNRGGDVHAEATPHHFSLTEDAVIRHGTLAKMNPPLRTEEDRQAILQGLKDGTIDLIATDHAPHSKEEKDKPITEAPSGIIGLETALPLGITNLVRPGILTVDELMERMSYAPAKMYHLPAGNIYEGAPADLVIFSMEEKQVSGPYRSKSQNSPFFGEELYGVVKYTICGGKIVFSNK
ncbi:MAG: dihydroorotase [Lachnospiraceae bacterium]